MVGTPLPSPGVDFFFCWDILFLPSEKWNKVIKKLLLNCKTKRVYIFHLYAWAGASHVPRNINIRIRAAQKEKKGKERKGRLVLDQTDQLLLSVHWASSYFFGALMPSELVPGRDPNSWFSTYTSFNRIIRERMGANTPEDWGPDQIETMHHLLLMPPPPFITFIKPILFRKKTVFKHMTQFYRGTLHIVCREIITKREILK